MLLPKPCTAPLPCYDWKHKSQRSWVELRTISWKPQWDKINSNSSNTNDRGYKSEQTLPTSPNNRYYQKAHSITFFQSELNPSPFPLSLAMVWGYNITSVSWPFSLMAPAVINPVLAGIWKTQICFLGLLTLILFGVKSVFELLTILFLFFFFFFP